MQALILARVSTEEQKTEGQSIPAQLAKSREYAQRKGLKIKKEYQFDESSLKDIRTKFEAVVDEVRNSKVEIALIVETVDNFYDLESIKGRLEKREEQRKGKPGERIRES